MVCNGLQYLQFRCNFWMDFSGVRFEFFVRQVNLRFDVDDVNAGFFECCQHVISVVSLYVNYCCDAWSQRYQGLDKLYDGTRLEVVFFVAVDCIIDSVVPDNQSTCSSKFSRDCNTNTNTNTKSQYLGPQYQYQYQYYQNFDPQYQYQYLDPSIPIPEGSIPQKWYWIWIFQTPHYKFSKLILRK